MLDMCVLVCKCEYQLIHVCIVCADMYVCEGFYSQQVCLSYLSVFR